jgi:hypothetical protein
MSFTRYYTDILRHPTRVQPRADEALRDYQTVLRHLVVAGIA